MIPTDDDLRFPNEGGEFDRIRRIAEIKSGGDPRMTLEEMELIIIPAFVRRVQEDAKERALRKLWEEERLRRREEEKFRQLCKELFEEGALQLPEFKEEVGDLQKIIRGADEEKWKLKRRKRTPYDPDHKNEEQKSNVNKRKRDERDDEFQERKKQSVSKNPKKVNFTLNVTINNGDNNNNNTVDQNEAASPSSTATLPQEFHARIRDMGGVDAMLVLQKKITKSDIAKQQNRLSIPQNQIKTMFLTQQEMDETRDSSGKIEITLIQPCLETTSLTLKKWPMNSTCLYVLVGPWFKDVVSNQRNGIVEGAEVQVWAFRINGKLCFALVNKDFQA